MQNKTEFEHSYLTWIMEQQNRNDVVGAYTTAVFDDFESGGSANLINVAELPAEKEIEQFIAYCDYKGYPREQVNLFILGNVMAAMEFHVGISTGTISYHSLSSAEANYSRQIIFETTRMMKTVTCAMNADANSWVQAKSL